jgi:small subunit ribosomal protein S21
VPHPTQRVMFRLTHGTSAANALAFEVASIMKPPPTLGQCLQVLVRDNNVDQALKVLKKRLQREGVFREMKLRSYYEKPSEKRVREAAEAVRRGRKAARKTAIREGLIAAPVKKPAFQRAQAPSALRGG